jgi:tRNA-2-methylthio-N6-dimethylallyladenosine synthase
MSSPPKLYVLTHGCQMNEYDSVKMADVLAKSHGYERTMNADEADLLLLNTCSVREKAQEKVFSELGRWKQWKEADPRRLIGVGGCVASQEGEAIARRAPIVDLVFGPQTLHRLPELLKTRRETLRPSIDVSFPEIEKFDALPAPRAEGPAAFVSIMEGCSKYCTFCVVPYTRGTEISRPLDSVLVEIAQLAEQGRARSDLAGAERERLSRHDGRLGGDLRPGAADPLRRAHPGHRARPVSRPRTRRNSPTRWPMPSPKNRNSRPICTCRCSRAAIASWA